jgi:ERCC4-related helicase
MVQSSLAVISKKMSAMHNSAVFYMQTPAKPNATQQLPVITRVLPLRTTTTLGMNTSYRLTKKERWKNKDEILRTSRNFLQYIDKGSPSTNSKTNSL